MQHQAFVHLNAYRGVHDDAVSGVISFDLEHAATSVREVLYPDLVEDEIDRRTRRVRLLRSRVDTEQDEGVLEIIWRDIKDNLRELPCRSFVFTQQPGLEVTGFISPKLIKFIIESDSKARANKEARRVRAWMKRIVSHHAEVILAI